MESLKSEKLSKLGEKKYALYCSQIEKHQHLLHKFVLKIVSLIETTNKLVEEIIFNDITLYSEEKVLNNFMDSFWKESLLDIEDRLRKHIRAATQKYLKLNRVYERDQIVFKNKIKAHIKENFDKFQLEKLVEKSDKNQNALEPIGTVFQYFKEASKSFEVKL